MIDNHTNQVDYARPFFFLLSVFAFPTPSAGLKWCESNIKHSPIKSDEFNWLGPHLMLTINETIFVGILIMLSAAMLV